MALGPGHKVPLADSNLPSIIASLQKSYKSRQAKTWTSMPLDVLLKRGMNSVEF